MNLHVGDRVERLIDSIWYAGVVTRVHNNYITIVYLDGKVESNVSINECRNIIGINNQSFDEQIKQKVKHQLNNIVNVIGLPEEEAQESVMPLTIIHNNSRPNSSSEGGCVDGAQNERGKCTTAAGVGVKALRYLKS